MNKIFIRAPRVREHSAEESFLDLFKNMNKIFIRAPRVREHSAEESFLDLFKKELG